MKTLYRLILALCCMVDESDIDEANAGIARKGR